MAKKTAAPATIEEKIKAALVPAEEQLYAVPRNWCWVKHNSILDISGGAQPDKSYFISEIKEGYTQLYQTRDYGEHPVPVFIPNKYATKTTDEGDILLARYGGSLGKVFRAKRGAYNVALAKVVKLYPCLVVDDFLYQYYLSHFYQEFCVKAASGRSAQSGFNRNDMEELIFPLPPLAEQQRIVDRIETMFAKLDEAKEKAQAVIDGYEDRKAAILHKAFTGELTAQNRAKKSVDLSSWKKTNLGAIVSGFKYGSSEKSDYLNIGTPVFRIPNIGDGNIDFDDMKYLSGEADNTCIVHENDVLIIRSNGSRDLVGKCAIVPRLEGRYAYASFLIKIIPSDEIHPDFLVRFLNSSDARSQMFAKAKSSSGIHNINSKELGSIILMLPELWEQEQIVTIIDDLLSKEAAIKEAAETTLATIDTMKQSILSRAFRGELGTNDPNDEPAQELLKRILNTAER